MIELLTSSEPSATSSLSLRFVVYVGKKASNHLIDLDQTEDTQETHLLAQDGDDDDDENKLHSKAVLFYKLRQL